MAGRYICPICDRRLKYKHFCIDCKAVVKTPVYYEGPVANENPEHNYRVDDCMAQQHYGLGQMHRAESGHRERAAGYGKQPRQTVSHRRAAGEGKTKQASRKGPHRTVAVLMVLTVMYMLFSMLPTATELIRYGQAHYLHVLLMFTAGKFLPFLVVEGIIYIILKTAVRK